MNIARKLAFCFSALALTMLYFAPQAQAQGFERNILTGGPSGTYIQFGRNISEIAGRCDIELNVQESAGSLENFLGVRKRRYTQFGIVQSDVLEYFKTFAADDPVVARAIVGVRMAFPLYNEEIHILARKDIASLSDLSDKKVAVGVEDSGTFLTASLVLDLTGITPEETLTIDAETSLKALLDDQIDAFFYVAGAPTSIFQNPAIDAERFHLLPVDDPTLAAVYSQQQIPAGSYPFQSDAVDTVAVKAVLMTYEYNPSRNSYHRESCRAVSDIAHIVTTRFNELREQGHPKWKSVDLNDLPPGWEVGSCVIAGLDPDYGLTCPGDEPAPSQSSPEKDANAAYRARICASIGC